MVGRDFFGIFVVLNVFPQNSQVPNVFPNIFSNSTSLCPICFAQHCPLPTTSIGGPILGLICFYVWNKYFFYSGEVESPKFHNFFVMDQSKRLITQKKKKKKPQLTNMDHTNKNKVSRCHPHIGLKHTIFLKFKTLN
jgi:hypothetical protein